MPAAQVPEDEELRLRTLYAYQILDTVAEEAFDDLCEIAASICGTPTSLVTLLDRRRQWFKARVGFPERETERECSFCAHAVVEGELLVVEDATRDARFVDNRLVLASPNIRFYAGVPLRACNGQHLGTLCVIDHRPRSLEPEQEAALRALARQAEAQLELRRVQHERRLLGRFVIHDMRNPLTVLLADAGQAVADAEKGRVAPEGLRELEAAAGRLHRLVEDLHALLSQEHGAMPVRLEEVDVAHLVDTLRAGLRRRLAERELAFETQIEVQGVQADAELLRRILENLVFNAVAVAPAGSTIRVGTAREGDAFVLRVRDEGPGVPDEERASLFTLGRDAARGHGLGLAFCRMAARAMGGSIAYEAPASERGATFRVTLPLVPAATRG